MIKNTTIKLVYQTVYVCLAIFGLIGSFGYFEKALVQIFMFIIQT